MESQKIESQNTTLQLWKPTLSSMKNDTLTYDDSIEQTITIPPWEGINKEHSAYLKVSGKNENGHTIDIDLLNAAQVGPSEETEGFSCALPNHWLTKLADNSTISITLAVSCQPALKPENLSSTQYKLTFRKPHSQPFPTAEIPSVNTSRWMTDNWSAIKDQFIIALQ